MKLLLDTHVFLWWRLGSPRVRGPARAAIAGADAVFVSAASAWELAIKMSLGRLVMRDSFAKLVNASDFEELPVTFRHAERVWRLPHHHPDPFDRMIIAQALTEQFTIVTHDRAFAAYDVPVLWT